MKVSPLALAEVMVIEPQVFGDVRGFFFESFNRRRLEAALGRTLDFVQDNHSCSERNVLRGLHYQIRQPQAKLVRVVAGEIFDVVVDIRKSSATFGQWAGTVLAAQDNQHLWIPEGFAHGFLVLSERAEVQYKTTDYWVPEHERAIAWDDPELGIAWPLSGAHGGKPVLSAKDCAAVRLSAAECFE